MFISSSGSKLGRPTKVECLSLCTNLYQKKPGLWCQDPYKQGYTLHNYHESPRVPRIWYWLGSTRYPQWVSHGFHVFRDHGELIKTAFSMPHVFDDDAYSTVTGSSTVWACTLSPFLKHHVLIWTMPHGLSLRRFPPARQDEQERRLRQWPRPGWRSSWITG